MITMTNLLSSPLVLGGWRELAPRETVEVTYEQALRWINSESLKVDFKGGELPFKEDGKVKYLSYNTPVHPSSGYGVTGLRALRGFLQNGVDATLTYQIPRSLREHMQQRFPDLIPVLWRKDRFVSEVCLSHTLPLAFHQNHSPRVVGWTMWEATRLPREWIEPCRRAECLIVPSSGQIPIFEEVGLPIHVVPDGTGVEDFTYKGDRDLDPPVFTFVSFSYMSSRKCPAELIDCFQAAFPGRKDVRLVMKTYGGAFGSGTLGIPEIRDERIQVIDQDWSVPQLVELLHNSHAGVFLSHGEGAYNPPVQSMATGLPVIMPNHSGCSDYANKKYNFPIGLNPAQPYEPSPYQHEYDGTVKEVLDWWLMDYDAVIETMRHVFWNREEAAAKGKRAAKWVRKQFSTDRMVDGLISVLNGLD